MNFLVVIKTSSLVGHKVVDVDVVVVFIVVVIVIVVVVIVVVVVDGDVDDGVDGDESKTEDIVVFTQIQARFERHLL